MVAKDILTRLMDNNALTLECAIATVGGVLQRRIVSKEDIQRLGAIRFGDHEMLPDQKCFGKRFVCQKNCKPCKLMIQLMKITR